MANNNSQLYTADLSRAVDLLRVALGARADVRRIGHGDRDSKTATGEVRLKRGAPIRLTLERLSASRKNSRKQTSVLVLNRASERRLEQLRRDHHSFIDIGRSAVSLDLPSLLIDRAGLKLPRRAAAARPLRHPFGDRASLVSRTLAEHPGRVWKLRELAGHADVSTMTASHAVRQLDQMNVVNIEREGRSTLIRLRSARTLVELWATHYEWTKNPNLTLHAPIGDPQRFLPRLKGELENRRWALTMHAGASRIAPHASWDKVHLYVGVDKPAELSQVFDPSDYEPSPEGRLVVMQPWYRDSVWHGLRTVKGLPVVSSLQLTLDLWHYQVRGREQAEHLLRTELSQSTTP